MANDDGRIEGEVVGKMGHERMVVSQVSGESLGWAAKRGSLASHRKELKSER